MNTLFVWMLLMPVALCGQVSDTIYTIHKNKDAAYAVTADLNFPGAHLNGFFAPQTAYDVRIMPKSNPENCFSFGSYKLTKTKALGIGLASIGGAVDGMVEGYEFDGRTSFERKFNASKSGFFGSESWRMIYKGGNPDNGVKSPLLAWTGAPDFYHVADDSRKIGYITGGIVIGVGGRTVNTRWWHYAIDFGLTFAASAATKAAALHWIRN